MRNVCQVTPEGIFKADAGLVPTDHMCLSNVHVLFTSKKADIQINANTLTDRQRSCDFTEKSARYF